MEAVAKQFGKTTALDKMTLTIKDDEYFALIGPIGSGKTTTLMLIAGLLDPDEGEIYFDRVNMKDIPPESRGVGYVFETFALFPHYNVWDNVSYGRRVKGEKYETTKKVAEQMLEMVLLEDRPDALPDELSGGMKQRAALARALASGANILLLDEPLAALDAKIRTALAHDLRRIVKELHLTAIHVTNSVEEAMLIADRIGILRRGVLEQVGTPRELYENPSSAFVMDFMGDVNLFNGIVSLANEDTSEVRTKEGFVFSTSRCTMKEESSVQIVIRAEDADIVSRDSEEKKNRLDGVVKEKMFLLGSEKYLIGLENGQEMIVEVPSKMSEKEWKAGDLVAVTFAMDKVFTFPPGEHK